MVARSARQCRRSRGPASGRARGASGATWSVPRLLAVTELGTRARWWPRPRSSGRPASLVVDGSATRATRRLDRTRRIGSANGRRPAPSGAPSAPRRRARPDRPRRPARRCAARTATSTPRCAGGGARRDRGPVRRRPSGHDGRQRDAGDGGSHRPDRLGGGDARRPCRSVTSRTPIVDFAAASDGYRDRLAAYRHCFEPGGRFTAFTAELIDGGRGALGLGAEPVRGSPSRRAGFATPTTNALRDRSRRGRPVPVDHATGGSGDSVR